MRRIVRQFSGSGSKEKLRGEPVRGGNLKRTKSSDEGGLKAVLNDKRVIFTVTYYDIEGAKQHFNTAADCIKFVFPGCEIVEDKIEATTADPETVVTIAAELIEEDENDESIPTEIWTGPQQSLSKNNPSVRQNAIKEINGSLRTFIQELTEE